LIRILANITAIYETVKPMAFSWLKKEWIIEI